VRLLTKVEFVVPLQTLVIPRVMFNYWHSLIPTSLAILPLVAQHFDMKTTVRQELLQGFYTPLAYVAPNSLIQTPTRVSVSRSQYTDCICIGRLKHVVSGTVHRVSSAEYMGL